jgi:hypothetical protein
MGIARSSIVQARDLGSFVSATSVASDGCGFAQDDRYCFYQAPKVFWMVAAMESVSARILSSDSASTITRARASVPE